MEELQRAIENITHYNKKFPKEELELISANRDAAIPYLREAVEKAIKEKDNLEKGYELHFYGMFLLAQFQDRAFFPKLMEMASLPEHTLDFLIGDAITDGLGDILYNTYNGDLELLEKTILDKRPSEYARGGMLDVMAQLYLDQRLGKQELQDILRDIVYSEENMGGYIYVETTEIICRCHLAEMLPELRRLYLDSRVDEFFLGGYDEWIDRLFMYKEKEITFCKASVDAVTKLKGWAMFGDGAKDDEKQGDKVDKALDDFFDLLGGGAVEQRVSVKIGRNDPCPCGSGKKYKQCCLKNAQITADGRESKLEQEKWLKDYPPTNVEREEGKAYLEDFYSSESIELDKLLYLALRNRGVPAWQREADLTVAKRTRRYLTDAYMKFKEIVERDHIQSFSEYDNQYSIHYLCVQWFGELIDLLKEDDRDGILGDVRETCKKMGIR